MADTTTAPAAAPVATDLPLPQPTPATETGIRGVLGTITTARDKVTAAKDNVAKTRKKIRSLGWRTRRASYPWYAAAATATLGVAGSVATEFADGPADLAIAGGTGAVALAGGWQLAKRCSEQIEKAGMTSRVQAGVVASCAWCLTTPLTGANALEMWLALGLGTVALSARWWQRIRPGYPAGTDLVLASPTDLVPTTEPDAEASAVVTAAESILEAWNATVTVPTGLLPGAQLTEPQVADHRVSFTVTLVPGKQTVQDLRALVGRIGSAIGFFGKDITFDDGATPTEAIMAVRISAEVDTTYTGPVVIVEGQDIFIEIGPYVDGEGAPRYHVAGPNSVNSGFVLGSKGSGKSRVLELIADGLRALGIEIWWMDPQGGASSKALKDHADWSLMGLDSDEHTPLELAYIGNLLHLWRAVSNVAKIREAENVAMGLDGFTHTRERPAIMVMIDECHKAFNVKNPITGNTFGYDFGELDRVTRKLGIGFIGASQIFTMETFGNAAALRSGMITGNLLIMRMMEKSHCGLLPGSAPSPLSLRKGGGWGYAIDTDREHVMWRARNIGDHAAEYLAAKPKATLDARATKAAGLVYRNRHKTAARYTEKAMATLEAFDAAPEATALTMLTSGPRQPEQATSTATSTATSATPAANTGGGMASVRVLPVRPSAGKSTGGAVAAPEGVPAADLKPGAQRVMILLRDGQAWHTKDMAAALGISEQAVRGHIRSIGETRLDNLGKGRYRIK
ncbi:sigma-70 family RNA polymerase sigma factor [Amycolatopsis japonica]|uniref:sigma-70 family RNA polymerase sigma factor n=1 Tax=Amycolatopsis japonica TaxID=208439 RepID=UPI00366CD5E0